MWTIEVGLMDNCRLSLILVYHNSIKISILFEDFLQENPKNNTMHYSEIEP